MANVMFKRGSQSGITTLLTDKGKNIIDGAFYLTTDSDRLYVGQRSADPDDASKTIGELKLLNQTVKFAKLSSPPANAKENDFCYYTDINALAVYTMQNGALTWVQINPDTKVTANSLSAAANSGIITITSAITNNTNAQLTSAIKVSADGGITLATTTDGFKISGDNYTLSTEAVTQNDTVQDNIVAVKLDSANQTDSSFKIKGGTNVTVALDGSDISISSKDTKLTGGSAGATVSLETIGDNAGKIKIGVTDSNGGYVSATTGVINISYGHGSSKKSTAKLGVDNLDVYTAEELDIILNGLDGMKFKAVLDESDSLPTIPETVSDSTIKVGDVYMASGDYTLSKGLYANKDLSQDSEATDISAKKGDLFIATGTEENGVITSGLKWYYVPSGDDMTDTTYKIVGDSTNNKITLEEKGGTSKGSISIAAANNSAISVSSVASGTGNKDLAVTISHGSVTCTEDNNTEEDVVSNATSITAVKDLVVNSEGHVTSFTTQKHNLMTYTLQDATVSSATSDGVDTATVSISMSNSNSGAAGSADFKISSSSLNVNVASDSDVITMNLEWGTF